MFSVCSVTGPTATSPKINSSQFYEPSLHYSLLHAMGVTVI